MKKCVIALLLATFSVGIVSGVDFSLSVGGGGLLGYTFTRYTLEGDTRNSGALESIQIMDRFNYGGFLFLDAVYGELTILFQRGVNSYEEYVNFKESPSHGWERIPGGKGTGTEMSIGFSLMGKYPFYIDEKLSWFPLLGIEYQIALLEWRKMDGVVYDRTEGKLPADRDKDGNKYSLSAWNSFWIDLGAGIDYNITGSLYVRGEFLFGFRLQTVYETGALEMNKSMFDVPDPKLKGLTGSPTLKVGIGYRF
ncbi:hypothetical protein AGMMS50293_14870 [Spirochaetia bacterium]|nr:hypothetical protein AGMMS50293_14870 [Spirochaetia bacterium]